MTVVGFWGVGRVVVRCRGTSRPVRVWCCVEHGISRKSFYELRKRTKEDGPAAVLEPQNVETAPRGASSGHWEIAKRTRGSMGSLTATA